MNLVFYKYFILNFFQYFITSLLAYGMFTTKILGMTHSIYSTGVNYQSIWVHASYRVEKDTDWISSLNWFSWEQEGLYFRHKWTTIYVMEICQLLLKKHLFSVCCLLAGSEWKDWERLRWRRGVSGNRLGRYHRWIQCQTTEKGEWHFWMIIC